MKDGKLRLEGLIAEIDVKIQTQSEKFRQGNVVTHNVIAEVGMPESEGEEEEEEEEEPVKDEYIAARSEENYSTFRAVFMTDPRL